MSEPQPCEHCPPPKKLHFAVFPFILAIVLTSMVCWALYNAFTNDIPVGNQRVLDVLLGNIIVVWVGAMGYFYNTTFGSNMKNETIAKAPPVKE